MMSNLFRNGLIYYIIGLIPALVIGWIIFPIVLYSEETPPVNFSHAIHTDPDIVSEIDAGAEIEVCLFCHSFRNDGTFTGIPGIKTCARCHDDPDSPLGEDPAEANFLNKYMANNKEVSWPAYFRQPDSVHFSHIAHVKMGNIDCSLCHGDHGSSERLPVYKKNRLTGYSINIWGSNIAGLKKNTWDRMKMDDCAQCHIEKGLDKNNACFVCHK